ncbi:phage tail tape measure protein [Lysinibacillus sp. NPDC048646]|uniref:phage tail tape measure protein n=1 Tax=Lysinibacillus sp. NPDC048646 TaxID=3390574 RepID=UPI003D069176
MTNISAVELSLNTANFNGSIDQSIRRLTAMGAELQALQARGGEYENSIEGLSQKQNILSRSVDASSIKLTEQRNRYDELVASGSASTEAIEQQAIAVNEALAEYNGLNTQLTEVSTQLDVQSSKWSQFQEIGGKVKSVGESISTISTPIKAIGVLAFNAAVDFETAFAGVRQSVNTSEENFKKLEDGIRSMAKELPVSATEIAGVVESAGQLGIAEDHLLSFSRTVIDLGASTSMTREQAATEFARFAGIVGMSQGDFDRLGSSVVELSNKMGVTESDIIAMGMGFAKQGAQLGMTEAQIMGLAGTMSSLGIQADTGGAAMTTVLQKIQKAVGDGGESLSGFAKAANMSSADFKKAFETDAVSALDALVKGLAESSEGGADLTSVLAELGVKGDETDVLLSMANASDLLSSAVDTSSQAWKDNTALSNEAAQNYKSTESQMTIMKNQLVDIGISIGNILIPMVISLIEKLQPWIEKFSNLSEGTQKLIVVIAGIAAAIGPVLVVVGTLASSIGSIFGAFSAISLAIAEAGGIVALLTSKLAFLGSAFSVLTGPVGWTIAGIATLIAGGVALYKNWDEISAKAIEIWEGIANFFSELWTSITELASAAWTEITQTLSDLWISTVDGAVAIWTGFVEMLTNIWTSIIEIATNTWETIVSVIIDIISPFIEHVMNVFSAMSDGISQIFEGLSNYFSAAWEIIKTIFLGALLMIIDLITFNFDELSNNAIEIFNRLMFYFGEAWEAIKQIFAGALDAIYSGVEVGWNKLKEITEIVFTSVKAFVNEAWINVKNAIVGTIVNIIEVVATSWSRLSQITSNTFNAIKNFIKNIWDSISTFVVDTTIKLVTNTIQKFIDFKIAIETKMREVKKAISDIWDKVVNIFSEIDLRTIGKDIIQGLINGIGDMAKSVWKKATSIATSIGDAIKSTLKINSPSRVMIAIGKGVGEGLVIGIEHGSEDVRKAAEELAEAAIPNITQHLSITKEAMQKVQEVVSSVTKANAAEIEALQKEAENKRIEISQKASEKIAAIKNNATKQQIALTVNQIAQIKQIEEQSLKDSETITKQYADKIAKIESNSADAKFKALKEYVEAQKAAGEMTTKQEAEFWRYSATTFKEGTKEKTNALKAYNKAYSEMVKDQFDNEKEYVDKRKKYNTLSLADELKIYENYLAQYEAGTEERTYYEEKFYDTKKAISEKIKTINNDYLKQTQDINKKLLDEEQKLNEVYNNALDSRTKGIKGYFGLFDEVKIAEPVDSSSLTQNLSEQVSALSQWRIELSQLELRGLSSVIIDELEAMGPSVLAQLEALNRMTDAELLDYQELYGRKLLIASEAAIKELEPLQAETEAKIKALRDTANAELTILNTEWQGKIKEVVFGTGEILGSMNDIGKNAIQGLIDGMKGMQSALQQTANNLVKNVSETIKKVFDTNPTSSLMQNVGEGIVNGFDSIMNKATNVSERLANSVVPESPSLLPTQKSKNKAVAQNLGPSTIIVQSVLDGQVLGESVVDVVSGRQYNNASINALTRGLNGI